ncbi:hypothetical protein BS329_20515 [Amycolatopsis coloradensis]|uniref:Carrier domain-containing protein n=1 Tax=Amycolatopsis coloradensis TaxID=76021 RepID=A0A1R0KR35_9PSEU|nr:hypothetical protein BS329_20515 [Amycolatopsis coloradensis]
MHALVAEQAGRRPNATAVTFGEQELTYAELNTAADELAVRLRAAGVGRGARVGVSLSRDLSLITTLLGVMKAGASYVPLDPSYPSQRIEHMITDSGVAVVVTESDGKPALTVHDDAPKGVAGEVAAEDHAYVIYTSGSTGRPKGVGVRHRNVAALLTATKDFQFDTEDVWTFFHSYAFDFSVWEIWGCLTSGGRLVIVPQEIARDPQEFHRLLDEQRVTVLNQTPSAFAQLLSATGDRDLAVRLLVFGGEQLDSRMLLPWLDARPEDRCRVVNMYGITETTVHCTWTTVTRRAALAGSKSVGVAIPGWSLRVVDPKGRRVPPGVAGEIVVGGAGVADGYLGRPELTAERFPSGPDGARLYRSGDRGRLLANGELEHLGRLDDQVKVRGHRIELGEIKAALLADPAVLAATVLVNRRGDAGDVHLDAYVVGPEAEPTALRDRLTSSLPAYMLPSTITPVPELPLTGNGKLDTTRLPAPIRPVRRAVEHEAGETGRLGQIWAQVLGGPVGLDDNLFLVGGNSLLAARIAAEIRRESLGDVSVQQVYRHPTIRALAGMLGTKS